MYNRIQPDVGLIGQNERNEHAYKQKQTESDRHGKTERTRPVVLNIFWLSAPPIHFPGPWKNNWLNVFIIIIHYLFLKYNLKRISLNWDNP